MTCYEELKARGKIKDKKIERVVFHEITKSAVTEAIKNPRQIDDNLVSAYMARRALDYLVGFNLSPVLWRKLPGSKSAGRVQSVALRLICEREIEIENFKPEEYWTIDAELFTSKQALIKSRLIVLDGKKLEKFDINTEEKALAAKAKIEAQEFAVANVERKKANRYPAAPFTTSTLQQEAARKLRFSAKKTMQIAQKLYEDGLITYMRTDAVNLSKEAIAACRDVIVKYFGDEYLPKAPKEYKTKSKNAQEAHEAIRPSDVTNTPKKMEAKLDNDAHRLYELIWKRTVACQMNPAVLDKVSIDSTSADGQITLRANGQVIAFDGFLKLYQESFDDEEENDENRILPNVEPGEKETKGEIFTDQHFTAPPPRFTEASLVKKLEELGIGFVAFSPLANGLLSGRYNLNSTFEPGTDYRSSMPQFRPESFDANKDLFLLLHNLAEEKQATPAQISLAWMLCKKPWIVPIPGTRKFSRLKENAEAAHVILSADEVRQIDAALSFMNMSDVFGGSPITEKSSTH